MIFLAADLGGNQGIRVEDHDEYREGAEYKEQVSVSWPVGVSRTPKEHV